jgi:type III secretory pathway component EscU
MFSYVDDIVVVSMKKETQLQDLAETFASMCRVQLKLNSEICVFVVHRGKLLGCLVSVKAIEPNPDKINATVNMKPLGSRK